MPGMVQTVDLIFRQRINAKIIHDFEQVFAIQNIQLHEVARTCSLSFHRRLMISPPNQREGIPIPVASLPLAKETQGFRGNTVPPVHERSEHVERQGLKALHSCLPFSRDSVYRTRAAL